MDCKAYQDLLIRLPYGELSNLESNEVIDHVKECSECATVLEENQNLYHFTEKLSTKNPINIDQKKSIEKIVSEINSLENQTRTNQFRPLKKISGLRLVRILVNTAAVFLVGLFFIQQIEIKRNLVNLQAKIEVQNQESHREDPILYGKEFTSLSDNQLEILVKEYDKLIKENSAILTYIQKNYPEIYQEIQERKNISENKSTNL